MAETCFLSCPEPLEPYDPIYGMFGPYGDTGIDSDTPLEDLEDQKLVRGFREYSALRARVMDNLDANWKNCSGPCVVYDVNTRQPYLTCPITEKPYHLPIQEI